MTSPHQLFKTIVYVAAVCTTAVVLLFLFSRVVVSTGVLTTTTNLSRPAPFISEPKPSERLGDAMHTSNGVMTHPLLNSPLYLDLTPPSDFSAIAMTVRYTNSGQRVLALGALSSSLDDQFVLRPAENMLIDSLPWSRVTSGSLTLLQREKRYGSLDEFFRAPPDRAKIATFHASTSMLPFAISDYVPAESTRTIKESLRGSHRIRTYVKDEPLAFSFVVQDMNRQNGADPVIVSMYSENSTTPITRTILQDDGNTVDDQRSSSLRTIAISVPEPQPGVYKIEFTTTSDVFIRELTTRQKKMVFEDHLYIGDHVGYSPDVDPLTVVTESKWVSARTAHPEALQTIAVGKRIVNVNQVSTEFRTMTNGATSAVTVPKRDMQLLNDGVFAFSIDELFNPLSYSIEWFTSEDELDRAGIAYILAMYEPPSVDGATKTAVAVFDPKSLARTKDGAFRFAIDAPGIADTHKDLRIESVTFTMRRPPISLKNVWQQVSALFVKRAEPILQVISDGTSYGESVP